ncbi:hypothetical protein HI914_07405 [Erysiphe necator]|nr:hypothetical protein HI914_07405 [Erysiphe necator]
MSPPYVFSSYLQQCGDPIGLGCNQMLQANGFYIYPFSLQNFVHLIIVLTMCARRLGLFIFMEDILISPYLVIES